MTFYSYPGSRPTNEGDEGPLPRNPRADEFYKNRRKESHTRSGFSPGEEIMMKGNHALVLHEEYDQHSNEVHTIVRESSQCDSGTKRITWKAGEGPRQMVIADVKKTTD